MADEVAIVGQEVNAVKVGPRLGKAAVAVDDLVKRLRIQRFSWRRVRSR